MTRTDGRREARWEQAALALERHGFALDACEPGALDPYLPFLAIRAPERCLARASGRVDGSAVQLVEYEWTRREPEQDRVRFESLVAVVENPRVTGKLALEPDDGTRWRHTLGGERAWIGPPDRKTGIDELDRAFRVYADSDAAARGVIPTVVAQHLVRTRFPGALELRPGRLLLGLEAGRLSPAFAKQAMRHVRALLRAFPVEQGGPFRSVRREERGGR